MYYYCDEFLYPFCELHLNLENYIDKESEDYYSKFLLPDNSGFSIFKRIENMSEKDLKSEITVERYKMNANFIELVKSFLSDIPNWEILNAYDCGNISTFFKHLIDDRLPPDKIDYTQVIQNLRTLEENYHRAYAKSNLI